MVVFVALGLSGSAFAKMTNFGETWQDAKVNVSPEGKNHVNIEHFSARLENGGSNNALAALVDVSQEGKNLVNFDNVGANREIGEIDSQMVETDDMRDTTSNYGVAPMWGNAENKGSWYELNIFGR